MRTIVYDTDTGEPLTAVNLNPREMERLRDVRYLRVAVIPPVKVMREGTVPYSPTPLVELEHRDGFTPSGERFDMLFTRTAEMALLMKPTMLAGQGILIEQAFNDGVRDAIARLFQAR